MSSPWKSDGLVDREHYLEQLIMPIIYWHSCSNRGGRIDGASNDQPTKEKHLKQKVS